MKSPKMNNVVLSMQSALNQNFDIRGGRELVHKNKDVYFNRLEEQDDDQFKAMVEMAPVYILYPKIVDGFTGTIFAKNPNLKGVELSEDKSEIDNVDMLGNSIDKFSEKIVSSVLENGFCASINDYSDSARRSFIRFVPPEQFISFRVTSKKGYPEIEQFIYKESLEVKSEEDEFDSEEVIQYTVLDMHEGFYRVRSFQETLDGGDEIVQIGVDVYPTKNGSRFEKIPMQIHGVDSNNFTIKKSPLQDLSDMNISVMQRVVDQVYMLHWTALPTPFAIGVDEDQAPCTIGPSKAWHIENENAKVGMLEFSGQSAKAHQEFIDNLKDIMAATGAQILKKEGVSRETATSVLVRTAAQTSLVSTLVKNVSGQIKQILQTYFEWQGLQAGSDFDYKLNQDFIKVDMEPNALIAIVKAWLDGAISHKSMFQKMKEGEMIDPNKTFEEEMDDINKTPPPFFEKKLDSKLSQQSEDDEMKGSNLENENLNNELATEQV